MRLQALDNISLMLLYVRSHTAGLPECRLMVREATYILSNNSSAVRIAGERVLMQGCCMPLAPGMCAFCITVRQSHLAAT